MVIDAMREFSGSPDATASKQRNELILKPIEHANRNPIQEFTVYVSRPAKLDINFINDRHYSHFHDISITLRLIITFIASREASFALFDIARLNQRILVSAAIRVRAMSLKQLTASSKNNYQETVAEIIDSARSMLPRRETRQV